VLRNHPITPTPRAKVSSAGKNEIFYSQNWQSTTIEQFIQTLNRYIRWYNEKRIKISPGSVSPLEYRRSLGIIA
jgi:transposase InsO family protein